MTELKPLAFAMVIYDMLDTKEVKLVGDAIILKYKDPFMEKEFQRIRKELMLSSTSNKYLDGFKLALLYNLDKLLPLVASRYKSLDPARTQEIQVRIKEMMRKVITNVVDVNDFDRLKDDFKKHVLLPIYQLFNDSRRR